LRYGHDGPSPPPLVIVARIPCGSCLSAPCDGGASTRGRQDGLCQVCGQIIRIKRTLEKQTQLFSIPALTRVSDGRCCCHPAVVVWSSRDRRHVKAVVLLSGNVIRMEIEKPKKNITYLGWALHPSLPNACHFVTYASHDVLWRRVLSRCEPRGGGGRRWCSESEGGRS
jgi:hypothetical protein